MQHTTRFFCLSYVLSQIARCTRKLSLQQTNTEWSCWILPSFQIMLLYDARIVAYSCQSTAAAPCCSTRNDSRFSGSVTLLSTVDSILLTRMAQQSTAVVYVSCVARRAEIFVSFILGVFGRERWGRRREGEECGYPLPQKVGGSFSAVNIKGWFGQRRTTGSGGNWLNRRKYER